MRYCSGGVAGGIPVERTTVTGECGEYKIRAAAHFISINIADTKEAYRELDI